MPNHGIPLGDFPLGGITSADTQSIGDPLIGLLSDPSAAREFLLRAVPTTSSYVEEGYVDRDYVGGGEDVDFSSGGYTSKPTDTPYKKFPSCIGKPYVLQVGLPLPTATQNQNVSANANTTPVDPALSGGATLSIGDILINNADSLRDREALLDWLGASVDLYIGRPDDPLTNFTRFFGGTSAGVKQGIDSWSILMRDTRFKLQRRLQTTRYIGSGAALRVATLGDKVVMSSFPQQTGSLTVEGWITISDITTPNQRWITMDDETHGWALYTGASSGSIRFVTRDLSSVAMDAPCSVGRHHIACVWDNVAKVKSLLIDEVVVATVGSMVGTLATSTQALQFFSGHGGVSASPLTTFDEIRIWNVAQSPTTIKKNMTRLMVGNEPGLIGLWHLDEGNGTVTDDNSPTGADGTITGCQWVGSLEGDSSIAGKPKPRALGIKRQVTGVLVDSQHLVYQLNDGEMKAVDAGRDEGAGFTFGVDLIDIYSANPAPATYNTCLAMGLARLGSSPIGQITWDIRGDSSGPLGYQDSAPGINRKLATQWGGINDPAGLDIVAYESLSLLQPASIGLYYDADVNIDVAMDDAMKAAACWWSPTRTGEITVGRVDPPETLPATVDIFANDVVDPDAGSGGGSSLDIGTPVGVRVGHVILGYRPYHTVLTGNQSAQALSLATRNDLAQPYRWVYSDDPNASDDADTMIVVTALDDPVAAQAESDRQLLLWGVDRKTRTIPIGTGILSYYLGTVFNLTLPRYDLISGKHHVAIGIGEDMGSQSTGGGSGASPTPDSLSAVLFG